MTLAKAARRLNRRWKARHPRSGPLPALIAMSDPERLPDPLAIIDRLPAGTAVILRDYGANAAPGRGRAAGDAYARKLAAACRRRRLVLLIAGDSARALRVGADGVHLPEWQIPRGGRRRRRRKGWLITAACHGKAAIVRARRAGADAVLLSPVFPTRSHPGARALGTVRFAFLARRAGLPVYALGGIDGRTVRALTASGAAGIAAVGAVAGTVPQSKAGR